MAFDADQFLVPAVANLASPSVFSGAEMGVGIDASTGGAAGDLADIAVSASRLQASLLERERSVACEDTDGYGSLDIYSKIQALRAPSTWPVKRTLVSRSPSSGRAAGLERAPTHPNDTIYGSNIPSMADTLGVQHHSAQKIRGKFSDVRRKEVQEVRKRGACIRCRMLRKTVRILKPFQGIYILTPGPVFGR